MLGSCTPEVLLSFRSHYLPRSRTGWMAVLAFLGLMALAQPPIVFWMDIRFGSVLGSGHAVPLRLPRRRLFRADRGPALGRPERGVVIPRRSPGDGFAMGCDAWRGSGT